MKHQRLFLLLLILFLSYHMLQYFKNSSPTSLDHNGLPIEVARNKEDLHNHQHNHTDFCVIAAIFNPASFKTQYEQYEKFKIHMLSFGVRLITVELVVNNQTFRVTQPNTPYNMQLKTDDVMWYKENLVNIATRKYNECEYIAWMDIELEFLNRDWVRNTIESLNVHKIVQPFEMVRILGLKSEVIEAFPSFGICHVSEKENAIETLKQTYSEDKIKAQCATDFAWVTKRSTLMSINGLFDKVKVFLFSVLIVGSLITFLEKSRT
jgi:hypothetical protein